MSILFLDQFSELGGGQQALLDTVDAARMAGWEARVLIPGRGPLVDALRVRNVATDEIPCGPYGSGAKSIADSLRFARDLRPQVRMIRDAISAADVELIYVNGPRLLPAAALAAGARVPMLFHVHVHLQGSALWLARWALHRTQATVVGCSKSVLEPLRSHIDARNVHVIPNGVRDAGYRERNFDARSRLRIGMIGRMGPQKGQMEFVNAAALLRSEFPQARFIVCGAALSQSRDEYDDAVRLRARGLPVEFVGWQSDVGAVMRDLHLLVVPSMMEGMGRVVLEAFSAGVPVVAFPAGGIREAIVDGVTGFLTQHFTAEALAARIRDAVATDPTQIQGIVWNARQAWIQNYTLATYQERIISLFGTLAPIPRLALSTERPLQHR
jgi:glycosyltransferase involved in cell wall biosynthesis